MMIIDPARSLQDKGGGHERGAGAVRSSQILSEILAPAAISVLTSCEHATCFISSQQPWSNWLKTARLPIFTYRGRDLEPCALSAHSSDRLDS
jgi:hypothetical protein